MPYGRNRRAKGFTLLEALVALAIFTAAAMSLYNLFGANLTALSRAQDASATLPVVQQAAQRMLLINPHRQASGQFQIDGFDVVWSARLLDDVRQTQSAAGFLGDFEVGLYEATLEIQRDERLIGTWQMRLIGYERVRTLNFRG